MALIVADRVQETTTTTGTGTYTLAGAKDGFQSFAAVGDGNTTYYACTDGTDYEVGIGTYTASGTTLARTTIIESSNSDAAVSWSAGSKDIFVTSPADKTLLVGRNLYADNPSSPTAPSATGANAVAIGNGATAGNSDAIAIGRDATTGGTDSIAIGRATTTGSRATALGYGADATGQWSLALGSYGFTGPVAAGTQSVAIAGAYASGTDSFAAAIANNTSSYGATATGSIAVGTIAKATGNYSVALGISNVANAQYGCAIGRSNTAGNYGTAIGGGSNACYGANSAVFGGESGYVASNKSYSLVLNGWDSHVNESYSVAIGTEAQSDIIGKLVYASGKFAARGDAQGGQFILRSDTTDATAEALTTNNSTAGTINQVILPNNSAYSFSGTIIARESATDGSDYASWEIKGALLRDANAASTVLGNGIVNKLYATSGASAWAVALSADTTNGGLKVEVTGAAATNIRWVATVNTSEVTYA